jgi:hypothetical protein
LLKQDGDQAALRAQALLDLNDQEYEMQLKAGNRLVHSLEVMFSAVIQQEKEQQKLGQRSTILLLTKHDFILQTVSVWLGGAGLIGKQEGPPPPVVQVNQLYGVWWKLDEQMTFSVSF